MWCSEARMAENMGAPRRTSTAVPVRSSQRGFRKAWTVDATMPPGNGQYRQQNLGAPFQNRMYGETVGGEHGGAAQAPQYTPQPFGGFSAYNSLKVREGGALD